MKRSIYILLLCIFIMFGCDTYNPIDYCLTNNTNKALKIIYNQWDYNEGMNVTDDSIVTIKPGEKKTLVVREIIGSGAWDPEYGNDTIWEITKLEIYKDDTVLINKNFRLMKYWEYNNINEHHSELNLTIKRDDIE